MGWNLAIASSDTRRTARAVAFIFSKVNVDIRIEPQISVWFLTELEATSDDSRFISSTIDGCYFGK